MNNRKKYQNNQQNPFSNFLQSSLQRSISNNFFNQWNQFQREASSALSSGWQNVQNSFSNTVSSIQKEINRRQGSNNRESRGGWR